MRAERIIVGILAHVDAGKTTLAESILYATGSIRKAGRVDHKDAYLDTFELEKNRGITIFSKQAQLNLEGMPVTLMDTPGHVDFSAEMERTLQVLDYAILVISGADGVQGHVLTLWRLLRQYRIPVFLFINKMDQPGTQRDALLKELKERLDSNCICFNDPEAALQEELASCDETLMEQYFEGEPIAREQIADLILSRSVFPCFFGSALKQEGVDTFLRGLREYMIYPEYPEEFSARIYKIAREGNTRLTYMKITGGSLKVKQMLTGISLPGKRNAGAGQTDDEMKTENEQSWSEKVDQMRLCSGSSSKNLQEAGAGTVCAVTGLTKTYAGQGLGSIEEPVLPLLEPVLTYGLELPEGTDLHQAWLKLSALEEEIPEMHLEWDERHGLIRVQVMGEVQIEILKALIHERYGLDAHFGAGQIVYKETIASAVEGVGHYEPLRHYAEVHLVMEPGAPGSGVTLSSAVHTDVLDLNWQRLILTHLAERKHSGVLTGSELTDVQITLCAGRAHLKHTEGGDFRQATYRAVRQGLMQAENVLLEPVYRFRIELPSAYIGRAMADVQTMHGSFEGPFVEGEVSVLTGIAPVACMREYPMQVQAYSGGSGRVMCMPGGYLPCHNTQEVLEQIAYDPDADTENPSGSVFCSHGAGMFVPWNQVPEYMHLGYSLYGEEEENAAPFPDETGPVRGNYVHADIQDDDELMEIFTRTFGSGSREKQGWGKSRYFGSMENRTRRFSGPGRSSLAGGNYKGHEKRKDPLMLVDGYNIIFGWDELRELASENMDGARMKLMDILSNYQGFHEMTLIVVFDAYKVTGGQEENERYHNIYAVYTREAETADAYIERTVHRLSREFDITVATSDGAEQMIIWGQGGRRMSARELKEEIQNTCREIQQDYLRIHPSGKRYLFDNVSEDLADFLEDMRLGRKK